MRRILIDDNVERLANAYLEDLLDKSKTGWREMPKSRLMMIYRCLKDGQEHLKCYVSLLMSLYERIIVLRSECFDEFHQRYFSQWDDDLGTEVTVKKKSMTLSDAVQWALRYDDLQHSFIPSHIKDVGIRTCIYCNEKSVASASRIDRDGNIETMTRYQIDHFYPQSKYPYLSTSFFNLQPSCDTCNNWKSNDWSQFNLFTCDAGKQDVFHFSIGDDDQVLNALINHDANHLQIRLESDEKGLLVNHDSLFHVESIYQNNHRKDALRIMDILYNQNNSYVKSIKDALGLFVSITDENIMDEYFSLFGFDMYKNLVHMRPLNKLAQDIVEFYKLQ